MIIDESLIAKKYEKDKKLVYVLNKYNPKAKRETKLGDVFNKMPSGTVFKEETGLGATTLELSAERHSIIVEPIKVTASSKAISFQKYSVLYVGSETKFHPKAIENKDIQAYLNDSTNIFKKILVVADSLPRLIGIIGKEKLKDFFFMIDEIDSFQLDSSYRGKMEVCMDIYKMMPPIQRVMVSATTLAFSDPELTDEPMTHILYNEPKKRNINLYFTPKHIKRAVVIKVLECLKKYPDDKIMIAFNSVKGCFEISNYLQKHHEVDMGKMKILCSVSNKAKIGDLYTELESTNLPSQITFATSAYFTGYDLSERYHLISVSSNLNMIHSLSEKRLKQIAGRCRDPKGLLSETILYDTVPKDRPVKTHSVKDLTQLAASEMAALNCIKRNYEKHPLLKNVSNEIRELVAQHTKIDGHRFVRMLSRENPGISYLNIDAYLESLRVTNELYREVHVLYETLVKEGHLVKPLELIVEDEIEKNRLVNTNKEEQVKQVLEQLKALPKFITPKQLLQPGKVQFTALQLGIIKKWDMLYKYIDRDRMFQLIEEAGVKNDSRKLNNLFQSAHYLTLPPAAQYKRSVMFHLPTGMPFSAEELLKKWNIILTENSLGKSIDTPTQAVRLTKLHFKIKKRRGEIPQYYIESENPYKLELLRHRPLNEKEVLHISPKLFS